jgi:hypothetical protein
MNDDDLSAAYARLAAALRPPPDAAGRVRDAIAARRRRQLGAASGMTIAAVAVGALVAADLSGAGDRDTTPPVVKPTTPSPSTVSEGGRQPSYAELHAIDAWEWQTSFGRYRKDLLALAESYDNYTGYRLNFRQRSLRVLGTGDPPPAVAAMIKAGPRRAHPTWVSMPYSYRQLKRAELTVFHAVPRASMGSVRNDFTGVVIGVFDKSLSPKDHARLQAIAREVTDVPVTFVAAWIVPAAGALDD